MDLSQFYLKMMFFNMAQNTASLKSFFDNRHESDEIKTGLEELPDRELYGRLLNVDFNNLTLEDKQRFLLGKEVDSFSCQSDYNEMLSKCLQEMHNRTCKDLGVKPTVVKAVFDDSYGDCDWFYFDLKSNIIIVNMSKSFELVRPSFLIEGINEYSKLYSNFQYGYEFLNQNRDFKNADELFLTLCSFSREYFLEEFQKSDNKNAIYTMLNGQNEHKPEYLDSKRFSFSKSRDLLLENNFYGSNVRDRLRGNEKTFFDFVSRYGLNNSLLHTEDLLNASKDSKLFLRDGGPFEDYFKDIINSGSATFFNKYGADFLEDEKIESFLDRLETNREDVFLDIEEEFDEDDEIDDCDDYEYDELDDCDDDCEDDENFDELENRIYFKNCLPDDEYYDPEAELLFPPKDLSQ